MTSDGSWPSVGVVVPTRDRPDLLRRTLAAIDAQTYPAPIEVVVVHDQTELDRAIEADDPHRRVRAISNTRKAGLAGARNSGILSLQTELVAFCDDDDVWQPDKLARQVRRLRQSPSSEFAATGITVRFGEAMSPRLAGTSEVGYEDLLRSRLSMLHSSTFLVRRSALEDGIGLVDEEAPGSMCEDWDILLRAARRHPIAVADEPLVEVLWGRTSFFAQRWETKIAAHRWMLRQHPDIEESAIGAARVYGQLAFSYASLGRRRDTRRWAGRSIRRHWREPRGYLALLVASGLVTSERVLTILHKRGRGI